MAVPRLLLLWAALAAVIPGCSAPEPRQDPGDKALQDPMNYNPVGKERYDVSGGGIMDFDRNAVRKDVNDVLSP